MDVLSEKERLALEEVFLCISPRRGRFGRLNLFSNYKKYANKRPSIISNFTTKPKGWLKKVLNQPESTKTIRFYHK